MAWEVWWALVLGFLFSGIVQAWVPRSRMEQALGGRGPKTVVLATGLGAAESGHEHQSAGGSRLLSLEAWSDVAHNFRGDWEMLWKEITAGFLIAGFIALLPMSVFNDLFLTGTGGRWQLLENVIVGPLVA